MNNGHIAVIGAGLMGAGIAEAFSTQGFRVRLAARNPTKVEAAIGMIKSRQSRLEGATTCEGKAPQRGVGPIERARDLQHAVAGARLVCESIPESLQRKTDLFKELSALVDESTILASNTSSLPLTAISASVQVSERFIGLHWLNPPHVMPLVEVIPGPCTTRDTIEQTTKVLEQAGRYATVLKSEVDGFVINRLQYALFREAVHLVENGYVDAADVDVAVKKGLGLRWAVIGPFEHMDLCGLDTVEAVVNALFPRLACTTAVPASLRTLVEEGQLGLKTGGGFLGASQRALEKAACERDTRIAGLAKLDRFAAQKK